MVARLECVELWEIDLTTGRRFRMNQITGTSKFREVSLTPLQKENQHSLQVLLLIARDLKRGWIHNGPHGLTRNYEIGARYSDGSFVAEKDIAA